MVKKDPRWQAAMAKRGITNYDKIACFPLAAGPVTDPALAGRRLLNVPCVETTGAENNLWGKPIEGVLATVDIGAEAVLSVTDLGVVPAPTETPSHAYDNSGKYRPIPKPVEIAAPQGSNISIDGGQVRWDNWSFHIRMDPRPGAVLSLIRYDDHGTQRDIVYELSASEMYVPYMSPDQTWSFRAYMDIGEYGFGALASQLHPGQDCPSSAVYLDVTIADNKGEPLGKRAWCASSSVLPAVQCGATRRCSTARSRPAPTSSSSFGWPPSSGTTIIFATTFSTALEGSMSGSEPTGSTPPGAWRRLG